ncbi:7261_t:CDS:2, partial [Acaulospora morrowiae]
VLYISIIPFFVYAEVSSSLPARWLHGGDNPELYLSGVETVPRSIFLKSDPKFEYSMTDKVFGTVHQPFNPQGFLGKRVQLTGFVKTSNVINTASMFLQIYRATNSILAELDGNIIGTADWKKVKNVLDVPQDTLYISFGSRLHGEIWICGFEFNTVDSGVSTTSISNIKGSLNFSDVLNYPTNLFELTPAATDDGSKVITKTDAGVVTVVAIGKGLEHSISHVLNLNSACNID